MSRQAKTKPILEAILADEVWARVPYEEMTQQKLEEIRQAASKYVGRQASVPEGLEEAVKIFLPGFLAESGVQESPFPLYPKT